MEKLISSSRYTSDHLARPFLESLEPKQQELGLAEAVFYYDFPSFRDYEDDAYRPSVMLLSPEHGVIALNLCDADVVTKSGTGSLLAADESLSQFFSILYGRLIKSRLLRRSRTDLAFPFNGLLYSPGLGSQIEESVDDQLENEICTSLEAFQNWLEENRCDYIERDLFAEARSIIEGAKAITRPRARDIPADKAVPKAHILAALEAEIANFDAEQRKAAITILSGPQRIRGLAGTGKTIVLAMKAAQIHLNEPERRVLYTFYTKSLYDLIKRLITRFYRHYKDSDPDWENVRILHAWGGANVEGVYHRACIDNGVAPLRWRDVRTTIGEPFNYVCGELLKNGIKQQYDYVLIDEGQDLPENFFLLCFQLAVGARDEKNIAWAYDELQNIFNVKVRSPSELFGTENGEPRIDLERASAQLPPYISNDIVLYKSYRNPKEILVSAHALGFGLYSNQIVQMLENREHWEDVGYKVETGDFTTGSKTVVVRPDENSPLAVSKREKKENIVQSYKAEDFEAEVAWIVKEIVSFIADGLRPEEVLVISLDDRNGRSYFEKIRGALLEQQIRCNNILDNPYTSSVFAVDGRVTLSTVHRAKGNEAAAVIAVGIDALHPLRESRTGRNRIFTAFTRAKVWLRVSGVGELAEFFLKELDTAFKNCPRLEFTFPDLKQVNLLQRDMSKREARLRRIRDRYRKELERLGMGEEEVAEFFVGEEKK